MTPDDRGSVSKLATRATQIVALAEIMAEALAADPDTQMTGFAVEGIGTLAMMLANDLVALAE